MSSPSFKSLLAKSGVTIADATNAIKKMAEDYDILEQSIPTIKSEQKKAGLSEAKKKELAADLAEAQEGLPLLDTKLVSAINAWLPKRQQIKERMDKMNAGRLAKMGKGGPAAPAAPEPPKPPAPAPEPPKPAAAAAPASSSQKPAAAAQTPAVQSKEGKTGSGILGACLAFIGGIAAGFGLSALIKSK